MMRTSIIRQLVLFTMVLAFIGGASMARSGEWPQLGKFYPDGHGGYVYFPLADISFADEVAEYRMGDPPPASDYRFSPGESLGTPNYNTSMDRGYVTLGCGGTISLQFTDNALVDVPGPDLYVFEIGPSVEPTQLEISANGQDWITVGKISGGRADVDVATWATGGKSLRYVRLIDLKSECDSKTPGADIDAVGAIGSGVRLTLKGKVLFDFAKAELKPEAFKALDNLGGHFTSTKGLVVEVSGHTDAVGSAETNQGLSERRAQAVAAYLVEHFGLKSGQVNVAGYGESQPVAVNSTDEGRQANRRVEMILLRRNHTDTGAGLWRTNTGTLALAVGPDSKVSARYPEDNGRWFGDRQGQAISGYWVENGSSRTCETSRDGSRHWGRIFVELSEAGDKFEGWWSYCDADSHEGDLHGERVR